MRYTISCLNCLTIFLSVDEKGDFKMTCMQTIKFMEWNWNLWEGGLYFLKGGGCLYAFLVNEVIIPVL